MKNKISFLTAITPVIFLIIFLTFNVIIYGDAAIGGPNQIILMLAASIAAIIGIINNIKLHIILKAIGENIKSTSNAIIILLLIGALSGTWLISGIIPTMVYYGLQIISPEIFLFICCIICAIISLATGSSWSTIATFGIALLSIGNALGINEGLVCGAIISGAYFGDKMSPLSDTTNLASAMSNTKLFNHIRYMMLTTIPSFIITIILFLIIGISLKTTGDQINENNIYNITDILNNINNNFEVNLYLLFVPVILIVLIIKKTPAIPALIYGILLGAFCAMLFQKEIIINMSDVNNSYIKNCYITVINSISQEQQILFFKSKGMYGMLNTIWLIISAMCFGGAMESAKLLKTISNYILKFAKSTTSLIASTSISCLFCNITTSDQYLAIVIPGKMFSDSYKKQNLAAENLSRTLEDTGTVTSVLIPWNTCGATQSAILGVSTLTFLPYCFFNLISPFMTIMFAVLKIKIKKIKN